MPKASIRDVARAAGVSVATASRVLSGVDYPVATETRRKVEIAAQALDFVPNALARSLSRAQSDTIGVVVPSIVNPYFALMIEAIEEAARLVGLTVLLALTRGDEARRDALVTGLLERRVEGLILCAGADDHIAGRARMPVPLVMIGRQANPGFPILRTDNLAAGEAAAHHLWELGHRRIAYLTSLPTWHDFHDRGLGAAAFLRACGAELQVLEGLLNEAHTYAAVSAGIDATALIASTDRHALAAMAALSDLGRRVPEDVSVIGFDDYTSSAYLRPSLTTMRIPAAEMGRRAVELLHLKMQGQDIPQETLFKAEFIRRGSTIICKAS